MRKIRVLIALLLFFGCARTQYNMFLQHHEKTYYAVGHVVSAADSTGLVDMNVIVYGDCLLDDRAATKTTTNGLYTVEFRSMLPIEDSTVFELPLIVYGPQGDTLLTGGRILYHYTRNDLSQRDIVLETIYY